MPESNREPDNTRTMEINGTEYTIREYFGGKHTINDIVAKRGMNDEGDHSGALLPPV